MTNINGSRGWAAVTIAAIVMMLAAAIAAPAQTYSVVYSFAGAPDAGTPFAGVIADAAGNLFGTTLGGGGSGVGAVYEIDATGKETVLYSFGGGDGNSPHSALVRDVAGNLYGTTQSGGSGSCFSGCGVIFMLDPSGTETVLYNFTGEADGTAPVGGLIRDPAGNFYGTTTEGGNSGNARGGFGCGVVFKLTRTGREGTFYTFTGGADGGFPVGGLVRDPAGNLYGTTKLGGTGCTVGCGVVFKIDTAGKETVLHTFAGGANGVNPVASLLRDSVGNLYGTTQLGGTNGDGTVFRLDPSGNETVLHSFTGADGSEPNGGVVRDSAGNLYGTTLDGGNLGFGVIFKLAPDGTETVLYNFTGGTDGWGPFAGLLAYKGFLYGTTLQGGAGYGVVFKITPH